MKILEHVPLAQYTTFRIGGLARFFCTVSDKTELVEAIDFAHIQNVPFFILGGGSNILVHENGFSGLVIKMEIKGIQFEDHKYGAKKAIEDDVTYITAGSGEAWDDFTAKTVENNAWGLENLSLIPGTVGASPVQNIGAYGVEVKDCIESVHVYDTDTGKEKKFSNAECCFGYRTSIFKKSEAKKYVITAVTFRLSRTPVPKLLYKDLKEFFVGKNTHPSQKEIRDAVIAIRTGKFPDLTLMGTAGSFWKNPIITRAHYERLKTTWPNIPSFSVGPVGANADGDNVKVPLAYILDAVCNLKGLTQGPVGSSVGLFHKQPLVVVAESGASAVGVDQLAIYVAELVKEKTGIAIEREVESV